MPGDSAVRTVVALVKADKKTQHHLGNWRLKTTIFDTGLYNLTKDETSVLVHMGKDKTEQWMLVRMKEQEGQAGNVK
jgi:hypothetical protein